MFISTEKEDKFDWAKYLMEGEDIDTGPFPDTPVSERYCTIRSALVKHHILKDWAIWHIND